MSDDLRPDLRERVERDNEGLMRGAPLSEVLTDLARDLQRAEGEIARLTDACRAKQLEYERAETDLAMERGNACEWARRALKAEGETAAARAECEKADDFGTRAELARLTLVDEVAALRERLTKAQRLFDESGAGHSRRCVETGDIAFDPDCAYCKALALLAEEAR